MINAIIILIIIKYCCGMRWIRSFQTPTQLLALNSDSSVCWIAVPPPPEFLSDRVVSPPSCSELGISDDLEIKVPGGETHALARMEKYLEKKVKIVVCSRFSVLFYVTSFASCMMENRWSQRTVSLKEKTSLSCCIRRYVSGQNTIMFCSNHQEFLL